MNNHPLRPWMLAVAAALVLAAPTALIGWRAGQAARLRPLTPPEQEIKAAIGALWQQEDDAAVQGRTDALPALFDLQSSDGRSALQHAQARLAFVQAWARARRVRWLPTRVSVRTPRVRLGGGNPPGTADVTAVVSEAWTYTYPGTQRLITFGLGREHYIRLIRTPAGWRIVHDWFTDPLDQDTRIPGPAMPAASSAGAGSSAGTGASAGPGSAARTAASTGANVGPAVPVGGGNDSGSPAFNRRAAVAYADKYCGAAPGCGNGGRYNPRFADYNGDGGDCTNFVSQVLSLGGGLRQTASWTYDRRTGEGTPTWVKSGVLAGYLLGTGQARVLARGTYGQVAGATAQLRPGDLIAYQERGEIVHLAVVADADPQGYVLVDSHTADRFHVPWDIGWDRGAVFVLLQMRQGAATVQAPALTPDWLKTGGPGCGTPPTAA